MQIKALAVWNQSGEIRRIDFRLGALNVITGDSRTGKSSLIDIVRFCLGSKDPHVPRGPISRSVAWYGALLRIGTTDVFVGRPAPPPGSTTTDAMLEIGLEDFPDFETLEVTTNRSAVREYLGRLIGIDENVFVPSPGQTRDPLAAKFVHALIYCFQRQGEIANPDLLFHHQGHDFMPQAIKDTLPYFLGASGPEELRLRFEAQQVRRDLRVARRELAAAEAERTAGVGRAASLISEALNVGLLEDPTEVVETPEEARLLLRNALDGSAVAPADSVAGAEWGRLENARRALASSLRRERENLAAIDRMVAAEEGYSTEVSEQRVRLQPLGLASDGDDERCPICEQALDEHHVPRLDEMKRSLAVLDQRLETVARERPQLTSVRIEIEGRVLALQDELAANKAALDALAAQEVAVAAARDRLELQSYVRGRISQYLEAAELASDEQLKLLHEGADRLAARLEDLEEQLDPDTIRSRTDSLLRVVGERMTAWAQKLGLEHSEVGIRIDANRLTVVADTPEGPAYMDRGEVGSGMNWVGYHLTAYLGLQRFFATRDRPVPRFLMLDQPSQAFFPPDRKEGGDLDELTDTDRGHTRDLYELTATVVKDLGGAIQVIALDHADFADDWFQEAVVERWRNGAALIPATWDPDAGIPNR